MSVTIFVHLNESENNDFDMRKFKKDIEIKYPGTNLELSNSTRSFAGRTIQSNINLN